MNEDLMVVAGAKNKPGNNSNMASSKRQMPVACNIPGMNPVSLVAYYEEYKDYYPFCEMSTKRWFVENVKPCWTIIDAGANIGYYTVMFSRLANKGKVFAFEPTSTIEMLSINLDHNRTEKNVELIDQALGNKIGSRKDEIYRVWGNEPEEDIYEFNTIDNFVSERGINVDAIKIDVDSYDFEVLQGAVNTINSQNPYIMVELNYALHKRSQQNTDALKWMAEQGYVKAQVFDGENYLFKMTKEELKLDHGYRSSPILTIEWR